MRCHLVVKTMWRTGGAFVLGSAGEERGCREGRESVSLACVVSAQRKG